MQNDTSCMHDYIVYKVLHEHTQNVYDLTMKKYWINDKLIVRLLRVFQEYVEFNYEQIWIKDKFSVFFLHFRRSIPTLG